jgi:hydrogenase maturation protease
MSGATDPVRIIGVGSPFAGDRLGLQAVERLRGEAALGAFPLSLEFHSLDRPGSTLLEYFPGTEAVLLVDAMVAAGARTAVQRLAREELILQGSAPSSHQLGVAESLALAAALGCLPPRLFIYGIEAGAAGAGEPWYPALLALIRQDLSTLPAASRSS